MYQDTITLFNRKAGSASTGDTWYPTVIRGVNLNVDRAAMMEKYGTESKDSASLHIAFSKSGNKIIIAEKQWLPPKEWERKNIAGILGEDDLGEFVLGGADLVTANPDGDFFWLGEWKNGIVNDADYKNEGFYGYMNRTYDYVFAVSAVAVYSVIPHIEIMGK